MINIHITFLAWLVELLGGLTLVVGTHILGHENNIVNFSMHTLGHFINFVILPCIFLINDSDLKGEIIESNWYNTILNICNCQYMSPVEYNEESTN